MTVFKLNVCLLCVVDLVNKEAAEALGAIFGDISSVPSASTSYLLEVEAALACFLLPCAAASSGSSTVSYAGQVKLQK